MHITRLHAENIKRLKAVEITPDGSLVQITGKNGQGKTSVLDAIWWALQGGRNIQSTPIRQGEESAHISLEVGKYHILRKFKATEEGNFTTSIKVTTDEGAAFTSPQQVLDKMMGALAFDPLAFTRMKPDEQIKALQSIAPEFDFVENDTAIKAAYDERRIQNRIYTEANATWSNLSQNLPENAPDPVDATALMKDFSEGTDHNEDIARRQEKRRAFITGRDKIAAEIERLTMELKGADEKIASWPDLPEQVDLSGIRSKMDNASEINAVADKIARAQDEKTKAEAAKEKSESFTKEIEDRKAAAAKAISDADIPVRGMSISEDGVILDGVPFEQASDAQQLHASIAIAMALNPKLKVIRVRDGSLMDDDAMKHLAELAEEKGYQVWIEKVDDSGEIGFVIEDGRVKGQDIEPTPPKSKAEPKATKQKPVEDTLF